MRNMSFNFLRIEKWKVMIGFPDLGTEAGLGLRKTVFS